MDQAGEATGHFQNQLIYATMLFRIEAQQQNAAFQERLINTLDALTSVLLEAQPEYEIKESDPDTEA